MQSQQRSLSNHLRDEELLARKLAEDRKLALLQQRSYTERFRIMMRLMRINVMLKRAVVHHKQLPQ